jgi:hypothetical protein
MKEKFTATMVHETDKSVVLKLREETGLGEKDLMSLVIAAGLKSRNAIVTQGKRIYEDHQMMQLQQRAADYNNLQQKMKKARDEIKAERARAQELIELSNTIAQAVPA